MSYYGGYGPHHGQQFGGYGGQQGLYQGDGRHHPFNAIGGAYTEGHRIGNGFGAAGNLITGHPGAALKDGAQFWGWGQAHNYLRHDGHFGQPNQPGHHHFF